MPPRAAGRFRHRVQLYKPTRVRDASGQEVMDYGQPFATVWAEVLGGGGGTSIALSRTQITSSHTVAIRNSNLVADINETWRIGFKGRTFEISAVNPDVEGSTSEWVLECTERVQVGG